MVKPPDKEGLIFKIKRFSVHDGPGIRTSVFLKGCPLKCAWCHSPEGISYDISIWHNSNLCIACGKCINLCPRKSLKISLEEETSVNIDRNLCNITGDCVAGCPTGAMQFTGSVTKVSEIMNEIRKDILFYGNSGGGVTLTGGEPLFQPDFSAEILKSCIKMGIHTSIETCLFSEKEAIDYILNYTDLFIVDLKLSDRDKHKYYTGKSNDIIKENFRYIAGRGKKIIVRIPMIEGITNTKDNLNAITAFVHGISTDIPIERINFNPLTDNNYKKLGIPYTLYNN